jgi:aromatic-amino-acid transaminase
MMITSLLASVDMAPRDPILGINEAFAADTNVNKVNLGVGVYFDDNGKLPLLQCVQTAEGELVAQHKARGYLPIDGIADYDKAVQHMVFGSSHEAVTGGRIATVQALGGTGGLKIGADFLKRVSPDATVYISDPSWENHRALFENAGFAVKTYRYYDASLKGVNFGGMLEDMIAAPAGSIVVLHAVCHNPTGYDLTQEQWRLVLQVVHERGLVPFLDMAYQGFSEGLDADGYAVRLFLDSGLTMFVSTSFSKSFSLYGERVGALSVVCQSKDECSRVLSQLKRVIRTNYSNPPTHGAQLVATVLASPVLRQQWEDELAQMRNRIKAMRHALVDKLKALASSHDFEFVRKQTGMFSYSGLSAAQVERLQKEFSIYAVSSGRICVAALNSKNIDYVAQAIAKVL